MDPVSVDVEIGHRLKKAYLRAAEKPPEWMHKVFVPHTDDSRCLVRILQVILARIYYF